MPYLENCLDMTSRRSRRTARDKRGGIIAPGANIDTWQGLMKINASTGEMTPIYKGRAPSNGAVLATAGDLVFWGDLDHKFRAFDADSGKVLWETTLNGPVQNSTITYAVNGKQYVAVLTGVGPDQRRHHRPGRHQAESHLQRALRLRAAGRDDEHEVVHGESGPGPAVVMRRRRALVRSCWRRMVLVPLPVRAQARCVRAN